MCPAKVSKFSVKTQLKIILIGSTNKFKGSMTLSITTLSMMTISIKSLYVTLSVNDTQHNNALPYCPLLCHYAGCHMFFFVILSVIMQSVVKPSINTKHKSTAYIHAILVCMSWLKYLHRVFMPLKFCFYDTATVLIKTLLKLTLLITFINVISHICFYLLL